MGHFLRQFGQRYFSRELDLRVRLFNLLAVAGTLISFFIALTGVLTSAGLANILLNASAGVLAILLMIYAQKSGRYQLCYLITIFLVFFLLFPALFFTAGGYKGGMPSYFLFAVSFTIFMLDGRKALVVSALELLLYSGACFWAYCNPDIVVPFDSELLMVVDIVIGIVTVSAALGITLYFHVKMYKEQQKKLALQNKALEEINRLKTEFLGNISHELKTPLTVVSSHVQYAAQTLEDTQDAAAARRHMQLVGGEVDRMALMVTQILDVSRIEEGRMQMELRPESMVQIVQDTLDTYYPVFSKNHNSLRFETMEAQLPVRCDRGRIVQVLVNLIGNASRHTRQGEIVVSLRAENGFAAVAVADTGEGIEPERIPTLFERYNSHRPPKGEARTGWDTGTGLGLYISKYIIDEHKGNIGVQSEVGKGTRVEFKIPLDT